MQVVNASSTQGLTDQHLVLAALGYEPRCTHVAEILAARASQGCIAVGYSYGQQEPSYREAAARFSKLGVKTIDLIEEQQFRYTIKQILDENKDAERIAVDISSLNRHRLAVIVHLLHEEAASRPLTISYLYSPAKFIAPTRELVQNESVGPVSPRFAGSLSFPEQPPDLIVGLGYENGKAVGAVEYLQSNNTWLFIPKSQETRYEIEVLQANHLLLDQVSPDRILQYRLEDPAGLYVDLCSLILGLSTPSAPILLPLGPKLFALVSLLVGLTFPAASVWRASQGKFEVPALREAAGSIVGLTVLPGPQELAYRFP